MYAIIESEDEWYAEKLVLDIVGRCHANRVNGYFQSRVVEISVVHDDLRRLNLVHQSND